MIETGDEENNEEDSVFDPITPAGKAPCDPGEEKGNNSATDEATGELAQGVRVEIARYAEVNGETKESEPDQEERRGEGEFFLRCGDGVCSGYGAEGLDSWVKSESSATSERAEDRVGSWRGREEMLAGDSL